MTKKSNILLLVVSIGLIVSLLLNLYLLLFNFTKIEDTEEEIEKKWLISKYNIPFDLDNAIKLEIIQTYLNFSPEIRVRNIDNGSQYILTIKSNMSVDGLKRDEKEYYISEEEYCNLLAKQEGNTISKTRYQIKDNGVIYEIDIFHNQLDGLAYVEVEFEDVNTAKQFENPDWVIKDVTDDEKYKNASLARYGIPK